MKLNKNTAAILAGMMMSTAFGGTALAATADSFTDVPKDHWAYEALDYLAKDGIIEGMGDNTFQGGRTMTRYEMAAIVAKAMQKSGGSVADKAVLEKLEAEYGGELATLRKQVEANTAQIEKNKQAIERVNLHGFVRTQWDSDNIRDADQKDRNRFYMNLLGDFKVSDNWTAKFQLETNRHYARNTQTGTTHSGSDGTDTGRIQRVWADGWFPDQKLWVSVGRTWRGLGFQNILYGAEADGVQAGIAVNKQGLQVSPFYMAPTWNGCDFSLGGLAVFGPVGHNCDINVAYARSNKEKWFGNYGWVVSAATNLTKDLRLTGDYVRTGAEDNNSSKAVRLDYKKTDLNKRGSYSLYARYIDFGAIGDISHDDEWGSLQSDSRGWILGVKYVPWKNVEWETLYEQAKTNHSTDKEYTRKLFRTQMDFHF